MSSRPTSDSRWFSIASWTITGLIVILAMGFAFWKLNGRANAAPAPTSAIETATPSILNPGVDILPALDAAQQSIDSIRRKLTLKTNIPEDRPRYETIQHTVAKGDSIFAIAKDFNIKPETVLWANYETLNDSPDSLRIGQVLNMPPVDGVYYQWQEGDTFESVAESFKASVDDILNWPGNNLDLTNPVVDIGQYVMIPGGEREFKQWIIPTIARGSSGTTSVGSKSCGGGAVGSGSFVWPAGNHFLSGNEYWSGHLGIDIAGAEGSPVYAADSGVVTLASGGWNGGYGNVIMIDHGNGYATLYGHLSQINVGVCQSVGAGQTIGAIGNTGNSFGAHLHFEVREGGGFVNPWYVLP